MMKVMKLQIGPLVRLKVLIGPTVRLRAVVLSMRIPTLVISRNCGMLGLAKHLRALNFKYMPPLDVKFKNQQSEKLNNELLHATREESGKVLPVTGKE